jgi:beta-mannanase
MMERVRQHGAIPFFSWASQSIPWSLNEPDFQLSDVIAGTYDSYIQSFAAAAKAWGHPFFLRFNFEMNGNWFPWSERANGNQPGEYVAAWRHVHDIFAAVGVTNATWTWCPNIDPDKVHQSLGSLYPGDAYVDWTCLDGYNWGTNPSKPGGWRSFDQLFNSTYHQVVDTIAPGKPMVIGETASSEYGGSKAAWTQDALSRIPAGYPRVRGVLWFEKNDDGMDWPIETSASATSAFAGGIQSAAYAANSYANLPAGPVQPPGA